MEKKGRRQRQSEQYVQRHKAELLKVLPKHGAMEGTLSKCRFLGSCSYIWNQNLCGRGLIIYILASVQMYSYVCHSVRTTGMGERQEFLDFLILLIIKVS